MPLFRSHSLFFLLNCLIYLLYMSPRFLLNTSQINTLYYSKTAYKWTHCCKYDITWIFWAHWLPVKWDLGLNKSPVSHHWNGKTGIHILFSLCMFVSAYSIKPQRITVEVPFQGCITWSVIDYTKNADKSKTTCVLWCGQMCQLSLA